jgi:hypothetical protein
MDRAKGIEIKRAKKDVIMVPRRNTSEPYSLKTGSQVIPEKNEKPFALIDGIESRKRVTKIPARSSSIKRADRWRHDLKT